MGTADATQSWSVEFTVLPHMANNNRSNQAQHESAKAEANTAPGGQPAAKSGTA